MRITDKNNISAIALFDQSLDQFETTMEEIKTKPNLFSGPAQYLQQALNRMITATVPDAHEMMRSLAERMLSGLACYSEHSLLLIASGSVNNVFRDEIMAIPYVLLSVLRGDDPSLSGEWLNRVNGNMGVESFLRNYKTSDIKIIHDTGGNNICSVMLPYDKQFSADQSVVLAFGSKPIDLTLSAKEIQTVGFTKSPAWVPNSNYRQDKPVVYATYLTVRPQIKEFRIPKTVRTTPAVTEIMTVLGCVTPESSVSNFYQIKMPSAFFSCQLGIVSFDSGHTWTITNIKIVPPSSFT